MHAFAEEAEYRALGDLFSAERPSFAASPVYAQEFQCGAAAGGFVAGDVDAAFEGLFCAGDGAGGAECAAEAAEGKEAFAARVGWSLSQVRGTQTGGLRYCLDVSRRIGLLWF